MANDVKIVISAVDNASAQINKVSKSVGGMKLSMVDVWAGINLAQQGLKVLGDVIDNTVGTTVAYNKQIREMTQVTGLGAEEISRIVQVADDWGIEIGALRTALAYMNKQGMTPSIANLAKLANGYQQSADKSKWAEENVKILGRGYQTLIPLLAKGGDELIRQTAAIDDNLIATDSSIRAAREYEVALDDWNDAVLGVKMAIGNELLPVLTNMLTTQKDVYDQDALIIKETEEGTRVYERRGMVLVDVTDKVGAFASAESKARFASEDLIEGLGPVGDALGEMATKGGDAAQSLKSIHLNMVAVTKASIAADAIDMINKKFDEGEIPASTYDALMSSIGLGLLGLSAEEVKTTLALTNIKRGFEEGNIPLMTAVEQMYGLVGAVGTDFPAAQMSSDPAFSALQADFGDAQEYIEAAKLGADNFSTSLRNIPTKIDVTVTTTYRTQGEPPFNPGEKDKNKPRRRQGGGMVFGGEDYLIGEGGPEILRLPPGVNGMVIPNSQITNNFNQTIYTNSPTESIMNDFNHMKSLARVS